MGKSSQILPSEAGEEGSGVSESEAIELTKSLLRIHFSKRYLSAQLTNSRLREPYDLLYTTYYQVLSAFYGATTIELSGEKVTTLEGNSGSLLPVFLLSPLNSHTLIHNHHLFVFLSEEQGNIPRTLDLNFWRDVKKNDQMLVDEYFILDIGEAITPGWFDPEVIVLLLPHSESHLFFVGQNLTFFPLVPRCSSFSFSRK
jgi:hypothetical protein